MADLSAVLEKAAGQLKSRPYVTDFGVNEVVEWVRRLSARRFENLPAKIQVGVSVSDGIERAHLWLRFTWEGIDLDQDKHMGYLADLLRRWSRARDPERIMTHLEGTSPKEAGLDSIDELLKKEATEEGWDFCGSFSIN